MKVLRMVFESLRFAWQALKSNLLRTILSLLGVTIGIFSIIGVYTMVDSLEANIKNSLSSIGSNTIYVEKFPWQFGDGEYPWWKYLSRPEPKFREYKQLKESLTQAKSVTIMDWTLTDVKYKSSSLKGLAQGITYDFNNITEVPIASGRYFIPAETESALNVAVIGGEIAEKLFFGENPLGKQIKLKGENFTVIGVQVKKGKQLVGVGGDPDVKVFIPFIKHKRMFSSGEMSGTIAIKAFESDVEMEKMESELRGKMRTVRGLRPLEMDDFALNKPDAAASFLTSIFGSIRAGGFIIGLFSLLIGGFGIANIMFVSVKERTNIIGIQKSLGAKNYFILFQFLFEAMFLCVIGGLFGLLIVYLASFIQLGSLDIVLTTKNIIFGISISSIIGIMAGLIPASQAAKMDPVIAIRAK
jgi:putative ABC transport system permease protein